MFEDIMSEYDPVYLPSLNSIGMGKEGPNFSTLVLDSSARQKVTSIIKQDSTCNREWAYLNASACFKYPSGKNNLYDIVHQLQEIEYCGCFGSIDSLHIIGGSILVFEMDCESG